MGKKRKELMELRFYDIPQEEIFLALLGEEWIREYGTGITNLHFHNLMEIGFCRDGKGMLTLDEHTSAFEPGMISVIPRNYPHTTNSAPGTTSFWEYLFFDPEVILRDAFPDNEYLQKNISQIIHKKPYFGNARESSQLANIVLVIMEEMREKNEYYRESVKGLANALIFEIARLNKEKEEEIPVIKANGIAQLSKALDYIGIHYAQQIRIEVLAKECGLSETHFRRLFTEYMNMTPVEYVNMIRIQMACEMMKKKNICMDVIAERTGFVSISTFNRNFKRIVGITPYQWKKNPQNYERKLLQFHITAAKGW